MVATECSPSKASSRCTSQSPNAKTKIHQPPKISSKAFGVCVCVVVCVLCLLCCLLCVCCVCCVLCLFLCVFCCVVCVCKQAQNRAKVADGWGGAVLCIVQQNYSKAVFHTLQLIHHKTTIIKRIFGTDGPTDRHSKCRESKKKVIKQVTWGHNIVADGWAGASNPHPHPECPPLIHKKHLKRSFSHFSTRDQRLTD